MYPPKNNYQFIPKKPVKSFQDLEVYQKTLEASVLVAKHVKKFLGAVAAVAQCGGKSRKKLCAVTATLVNIAGSPALVDDLILKGLLPCALGIPHQIAEAHSLRFGSHEGAIVAIEKAMLNCNKVIVYLEQFRDICDTGIEWEAFDDLIKKYLYVRRKILNLERSWKKFMPMYKES